MHGEMLGLNLHNSACIWKFDKVLLLKVAAICCKEVLCSYEECLSQDQFSCLRVYWEVHFNDSDKNRGRRDYHIQRRNDLLQYVKCWIAKCQYLSKTKLNLTPITFKRYLKRIIFEFWVKTCFEQEWFSVKCLLAYAIEIAVNLNKIGLSAFNYKKL